MGALCGRLCSFKVDDTTYTSHNVDLSLSGQEFDITKFGDGEFGDFVVCFVNGTVTAGFYANIVGEITPGDEVDLELVLGYEDPITIDIPAVVESVSTGIDAKGVALFTGVFKITDDIAPEASSSST